MDIRKKYSIFSRIYWFHYFFKIMPAHIKRVIFISTIFSLIRGDRPITESSIKNLNEIMNLCYREECINLSNYFTDIIWKDQQLKEVIVKLNDDVSSLTEKDISFILNKIKENTPDELNYGKEDMENDLNSIFFNRYKLLLN